MVEDAGYRRLTAPWLGALAVPAVLLFAGPPCARAERFVINTPGGPITVDVSHAGPRGDLVAPAAPVSSSFGPPTVFSAPLPSGSGARALGLAGAFTAIADDATAASWNPGGLTQLERPEASIVLRAGHERNRHRSGADDFRVGTDEFDTLGVNYLSQVFPFRFAHRNWVFSANYQEAYDFTQSFTADISQRTVNRVSQVQSQTYEDTQITHFDDGRVQADITSRMTTRATSTLTQILSSDMLSSLEFDQEGLIDALTPALAVEVTPKVSLGAALNFYREDYRGQSPIRSRTLARYSGTSADLAQITTERVTTGTYTYQGVAHLPAGGTIPFPVDLDIQGEGDYPAFSDSSRSSRSDGTLFEGEYEEINTYNSLNGINATLGGLWTVSRRLGLGAAADIPWTASGSQTRTVRNTITTYNAARTAVLSEAVTEESETRDIRFHFPGYYAAGAVWRWNNVLYSTLDTSMTQWSDFWYRSEGAGRVNPFNGSAYGDSRVDDCWAMRMGLEYLWVLRRTEIPFRAGASWEQYPAIGQPDEYWGVSIGSGVSMGTDPGKLILDFAYVYTWGDDVMGSLVPAQTDLHTDVRRHQFYLSTIWHF